MTGFLIRPSSTPTATPQLVNWEHRPAVTIGKRAWAIFAPGETWTEVSRDEILESGYLLTADSFKRKFGAVPLLPEGRCV